MRLLTITCIAASLSSCVMGPAVSATDKAAAVAFTPPSGRALLYVYRTSSISTMTAASLCWINGNYIGKNGSGNFMAIPLKPGNYTVNPIGNPGTEAGRTFPPVKITAAAGKNYFIRQKITPTTEGMVILPTGVVPGLRFGASLVSESIGRQEVTKCRQVGFIQSF
jgi:Protein of unknown function (DUF2846)